MLLLKERFSSGNHEFLAKLPVDVEMFYRMSGNFDLLVAVEKM